MSYELFDSVLILVSCLESESALLSLQALDFDLFIDVASVLTSAWHGRRHSSCLLLARKLLLRATVFDIDGESLRRQEAEPLKGLRVKTDLSEGVVPIRNAEVHDHEAEVVCECVGDEEPLAREILEPDLRLCISVLEDQRKTTVFDF